MCPGRRPPSPPIPGRRNRVLSRWRVFAGAVAQTSPHGLQMGVQAVIYHGDYLPFRDPNSEENSNDIALVHLSSSLVLTGNSGTDPWPWGLPGPGRQRRGWGLGIRDGEGNHLERYRLGIHRLGTIGAAIRENHAAILQIFKHKLSFGPAIRS